MTDRINPTMLAKIARLVEESFKEGYDSYETMCCAFNSKESAWENSDARKYLLDLLEKNK